MTRTPPQSFYRLVYFSPRPEDGEQVCVAIVFHDERGTFVDYDDKLEKAHCLAPDYTKQSLAFVLQTMQQNAEHIAAEGKLIEFSPQFRLSSPRNLLHPIDHQVRAILRGRYLLKPRSVDYKRRERGVGRRIDGFLTDNLQLPSSLIRCKPTVDELIGTRAASELPNDLRPKPVARALIAESGVCLLDGVDLHVESADLLVHRVSRVAHTFWQYDRVRQMLLDFRRKTVIRAAVIFDGDGTQSEPSIKWRQDYVLHELEKDADITVKAGSRDEESNLLSRVRNLLPTNRLNTEWP